MMRADDATMRDVRTTVTIDDGLLRRAKSAAASGGRSLGDIIDDALRVALVERAPSRGDAVLLPTDGGSGLQPGVDLEDTEALVDLLDATHAPHRAAG